MTMERHERIAAIFSEARTLGEPERAQFLEKQCGNDKELRRDVEEYLQAELKPEATPLDVPLVDAAAAIGLDRQFEREEYPPGAVIDRYTIIKRIGQGGCGNVYLAEQVTPVRRRVALKVLRAGLDTAAVLARFRQEQQALAVMDHNNVAKVLDGGQTEKGRPYFVMEYVDGSPITTFCDEHRYTIRQRLELFVSVCEAVQHAHLKGVIHRDLTPRNILVSAQHGKATVKVIDFGIAKAVSHDAMGGTIVTEVGQLIGTPEYMSPEQADADSSPIDSRTDVYSLGAILYELLSGHVPFDSKYLRSRGHDAIRRVLREQEPERPSTRFATGDAATISQIAMRRQVERDRLAIELRDELDWIPLKAIRKSREERYGTPSDLAADVRRYLNGETIMAGPQSASLRVRRLARRHRKLSIFGAIVLVIAGGVSMGVWRGRNAVSPEEPPIALVVRKSPISQAVRIGSTVYLPVEVSGTGPMTFKWRRNGRPLSDGPTPHGSELSGSRSEVLVIKNVQLQDMGPADQGGAYDCVITGPLGSVTTSQATLGKLDK